MIPPPPLLPPPIPSLRRCLCTGSLGFCAASCVVFATVAFAERRMYDTFGLPLSYLIWTLLFFIAGGAVFNSIVVGSRRGGPFFAMFALAFLAYAAGWTGAYFLLRSSLGKAFGESLGEWCGSLLGTVLMGALLAAGFRVPRLMPRLALLLFATHSLGYFLGSALNGWVGGPAGMLLWGVAYGLGFGAGIGAALHAAQKKVAAPNN